MCVCQSGFESISVSAAFFYDLPSPPTLHCLLAALPRPHVFAQKNAISFFPRMQFLDQHKRYSSGVGEFIPWPSVFFLRTAIERKGKESQ